MPIGFVSFDLVVCILLCRLSGRYGFGGAWAASGDEEDSLASDLLASDVASVTAAACSPASGTGGDAGLLTGCIAIEAAAIPAPITWVVLLTGPIPLFLQISMKIYICYVFSTHTAFGANKTFSLANCLHNLQAFA